MDVTWVRLEPGDYRAAVNGTTLRAIKTGSARWTAYIGSTPVGERNAYTTLREAKKAAEDAAQPAQPTRLLKFQPSPVVDHIDADDGHEYTQLPYPFVADNTGNVRLRIDADWIVGFQDDLARMRIDLRWTDVWENPQSAVGKYIVTSNAEGQWSVHLSAISSVEVLER